MMKNLLKNTILLFLLVFAVMLVPKTFANITAGQKGSITISGIKEANTTINLYKVIDVHFDTTNQQPTEPVYTWNSAVGAWIMSGTNTTFKSYVKEVTSGSPSTTTYEVTAEFNSSKSNKEEIATFYKAVEDAIKNGEITLSPAITKTDTVKGTNTISDVEMGGYLISIPKKGDYTYNPSAANVFPKWNETNKWVIQNGEAVAKASTPQIEKKIRDNDKYLDSIQTWIGKEIPFVIDVDVPNYPSDQAHKELKISDTFAPGLTYQKNLIVYGVYGGEISGTLTEGVNYTITSSATANGFVLEINNTEYETLVDGEGHKYEELHLEYSGKLNEKAATASGGNINEATYDYDNNQSHDDSHVTVYTYGVKIHKFKLENGTYDILPGAVFKLTDKEGKIGSAGSVLKFKAVTGETGVYYYDPTGDEEITVPASGKLVLKGLPEGTYTLEETQAPPTGGYIKLQQTIDIVIKDAKTVDGVTTLDGVVDDALNTSFTNQKDYVLTDGLADQDVVNSQGFELPVTGGIGTLLFSVLGIVFMGIAALLVKSIFKGKKVENN